jgi:hypothetical protein
MTAGGPQEPETGAGPQLESPPGRAETKASVGGEGRATGGSENSEMGFSCISAALAGLLGLATLMIIAGLALLDSSQDIPVGPPPGAFGALLLMVAIPLGIIALTIAIAAGDRAKPIKPLAILAIACIVGSYSFMWFTHATKTYFTAEIVSIVKTSDFSHDDEAIHVVLENDQTMRLAPETYSTNPNATIAPDMYRPNGGRVGADSGELLLAGNSPGRWYVAAGPYDGSDGLCYRLSGSGFANEKTVDLSWGLRLPYSAERDSGMNWTGSFSGDICLDRSGAVRSIQGGI